MRAIYQPGDVRFKDKPFARKDVPLRLDNSPPGRRWVQILSYHSLVKTGFVADSGSQLSIPVPQIVDKKWGILTEYDGRVYDYVTMPDTWQWFLWHWWRWCADYRLPKGRIEEFYPKTTNSGTFARCTPGSQTEVYVSMVEKSRAFTDSGAPEVGTRDVVTGRNMDNSKGYQWLMRPCAGQLGAVRDGGYYWIFDALDITQSPPSIGWLAARPWLYNWSNEILRTVVSNFPQIETANEVWGLPIAGISVPLMSLGGSIKIPKAACRLLSAGDMYDMYRL